MRPPKGSCHASPMAKRGNIMWQQWSVSSMTGPSRYNADASPSFTFISISPVPIPDGPTCMLFVWRIHSRREGQRRKAVRMGEITNRLSATFLPSRSASRCVLIKKYFMHENDWNAPAMSYVCKASAMEVVSKICKSWRGKVYKTLVRYLS